ncbi:MAG TPA: Yip1 family protein, partial [Thermomicrobiales bacterium]|nr:Yip1 family protein [Thermomicrobiales bacterium]
SNGAAPAAANKEETPDGEAGAPRPPTLVRAEIEAIESADGKAKRVDRKAGRMDVQHAAAAEALTAIDPNNAAIAPLIRYVNAVSMHLNESQKTIGRLQIERDALRAQVLSLDADPIDASRFAEIAKTGDAADGADAKQQRRSERQAAKAAAGDASEEASDEDATKSMDDTGRKRRLIALGVLAAVGLVALATRVMNHPVDLSNMSKGSLGGLAVVGQFMQVFLAGMIFYRLARIGGRAGRWLFPENDPKLAKKQLQEAKVKQKKNRHADA